MQRVCPHCGHSIEVELRFVPRVRKFDHDQALALLRFGATQTEVANTFGVSKQRISQIAKRARVD
jgi:hypothetical protein